MTIALGSDHHGVSLRTDIANKLRESGCHVIEFGPQQSGGESVDYPDIAEKVAMRITHGEIDRGILICGTGIGMSIAANKYHGVRAAVINNEHTAVLSRRHNNLNVLCLPGEPVDTNILFHIVDIWMETPFDGGRHEDRIKKIEKLKII